MTDNSSTDDGQDERCEREHEGANDLFSCSSTSSLTSAKEDTTQTQHSTAGAVSKPAPLLVLYDPVHGVRRRKTMKAQTLSEKEQEEFDEREEINGGTSMNGKFSGILSPLNVLSFLLPRSTKAPKHSLTREQIVKDESKKKKIILRVVYGACLFALFSGTVYMGHLYISALVALIELLLFRELVRVRYNAHFDTIQGTIPLFRTTQWCWFALSIFFTYGDFISDFSQSNQNLHHVLPYTQILPSIGFLLYSGTFVLTIATLQREHIKFQLNQICWTILVICLTVGQLKYVFHNIFNGLIWFVLPCCLVFCNDIMAYVSGMTCGRKFIQRPFIHFSPNKTWEGFIGGGICTMIAAWYLSAFLAQFTWMTCPTNEFRIRPTSLQCELDPIFLEAQSYFPSQVFEVLPRGIVKLIPHIVEICSVKVDSSPTSQIPPSNYPQPPNLSLESIPLTPCISGDETHTHHHFELTLRHYYPIQMHALWLALFASFVAPFGGFLASAIKRAYGIKDFDSIIPGHGGVMDRMDCQFLMALCTWVHYNTFVKLTTVSVPRLTYLYSLLTEQEKKEFLEKIAVTTKGKIKKTVTNWVSKQHQTPSYQHYHH